MKWPVAMFVQYICNRGATRHTKRDLLQNRQGIIGDQQCGRAPHYPMRSSHSSMGSNHVFANGILYWFIASDTDEKIPGLILTVDMEQNFGTIDLPLEVTEHSYLVVDAWVLRYRESPAKEAYGFQLMAGNLAIVAEQDRCFLGFDDYFFMFAL
ncbi:hypothetical protein CCACVL1_12898 [Corchorus capsularis]|uniref:Uncharacterized protein n=1 Tax=Corchorus capsularis TaxID=210143 RepID=A0A1R3IDD0_COCAP|nr:hypothetical protein CCACVL1_12898 [Corchorus capsularis]